MSGLVGLPGPLLALADRVVNSDAVALSPTIGWLMLLAATLLGLVFVLHREGWRRIWLRAEDPRSIAVFRVVFGLLTMANINGLWELFTYLFTDEGLFLTDAAREVFAASQFEGFGDGLGPDDPYGFFGWGALVEFLKGPKFSLLFFWDSPTAFWIHLAAFEVACVCFVIGFKTQWTKWLTLLLFHSIILRNPVFWEGTENVYRCFLFYLCLSRCGAAYSVDNWLRCRRLRREGRLSERGGPGDGAGAAPSAAHPRGLEAIYRLVPAWPRMLMILQTAALYCTTGVVKNGGVWAAGDAFYYALNLDHFYRFEPQQLSAIFGTTLFRLSTHVVHAWEAGFPLVVLGLVIRFARREKIPALTGAWAWASRLLWVGFGATVMAIVLVALPVHWPDPPPKDAPSLAQVETIFTAAWLGLMAAIAVGWPLLDGRRVLGLRLPRWLNHEWVCTWLLGRRVWLGLGVIFHAHLMVMMNIGWFTPATVSTYIIFLNGSEIAHVIRQAGIRLGRLRVPGIPGWVRRGEPVTRAEDPTLPHLHRDAAALPGWALTGGLLAASFGVVLAVPGALLGRPIPWVWSGMVIVAGMAALAFREARARVGTRLPTIDPNTGRPTRPWAYGPLGRFAAGALVIYQVVGVAVWLMPEKDCLSTWRSRAQDPFKWWLRITHTSQGWNMFAPNPPRTNLFMRVLVEDAAGETYDLNTDVYHPANRPIPWIWYTRQRKINRRVVGAEGGAGAWYQKWHARWVCRDWALRNGGEEPAIVKLVKVSYNIPAPEWTAEHGAYDPQERFKKTAREQVAYTAVCADEVHGQLPDWIRARHGLPPLPPERPFKAWPKERAAKWTAKVAERRKQGRDPGRPPVVPALVVLGVAIFVARWRRMERAARG